MSGSDVHTSLGDPGGAEATSGANIKLGVELIDVRLEITPARLGRVEGWEEGVSATEVIGHNKMERLADGLALGGGVPRWSDAAGDVAEDGEVEGARCSEKGAILGERRKGESKKEKAEEEKGHWGFWFKD